jgi:hypothetical protein
MSEGQSVFEKRGLDELETIVCPRCSTSLARGRWLGSMKSMLESHQRSYACLQAYVKKLSESQLLVDGLKKGTQ